MIDWTHISELKLESEEDNPGYGGKFLIWLSKDRWEVASLVATDNYETKWYWDLNHSCDSAGYDIPLEDAYNFIGPINAFGHPTFKGCPL